MAHPKGLLGARAKFNPGERGLYTDFNSAGDVALTSLWHLFARLCESGIDGNPIQGFAGDDCLVTLDASPLTLEIAAGFGVLYTSATALGTFGFGPYQPISVAVAFNVALGAHDATNPRIDIVCLAPAEADDTSQNRNVMDPVTLDTATQSVDKRTVLSYAYVVVAGTPAGTPAIPATPAGYIKIAECLVPAAAGDAVVTDVRPLLQFGHAWRPHPADVTDDYVPGTSTELGLVETGAMSVITRAGEAIISGFRYRYEQATLTIAANGSGNDRFDLVVADEDGTTKVVQGTPAGSPVAPSPGAGQQALYTVSVLNGTAGIVGADFLDVRVRLPIGTGQIQPLAVTTPLINTDAVTTPKVLDANITAKKLSVVPAHAAFTIGAEAGNTIVVGIQAKDTDGVNIARTVRFMLTLMNSNGCPVVAGQYSIQETGAGAAVRPTNPPATAVPSEQGVTIETNGSGVAEFTVVDLVPGVSRGMWVRADPIDTPGYPTYADLPFN